MNIMNVNYETHKMVKLVDGDTVRWFCPTCDEVIFLEQDGVIRRCQEFNFETGKICHVGGG